MAQKVTATSKTDDDGTVVTVNIGGFYKADEIQVKVAQGVVFIEGKCVQETIKEDGKVQKLIHNFSRHFRLPAHADYDKISAVVSADNMRLVITVPYRNFPVPEEKIIPITKE